MSLETRKGKFVSKCDAMQTQSHQKWNDESFTSCIYSAAVGSVLLNWWLFEKTPSNVSEHSWSQVLSQEMFFCLWPSFIFLLTCLLSLVWQHTANTKPFYKYDLYAANSAPIIYSKTKRNKISFAKFTFRSADCGSTLSEPTWYFVVSGADLRWERSEWSR